MRIAEFCIHQKDCLVTSARYKASLRRQCTTPGSPWWCMPQHSKMHDVSQGHQAALMTHVVQDHERAA